MELVSKLMLCIRSFLLTVFWNGKMTTKQMFPRSLAPMIDTLQERFLKSNALQARNTNIARGDQLIRRTIDAFQILENH